MGSLPGLLEGRQWAQLVKALDAALPAAGGDRRQLLLNRAFCFQQLGLLRKALKVGGHKCRAMWASRGPAAAAVMQVKRSDAGASPGSPENGARRPAASCRRLPPLGLWPPCGEPQLRTCPPNRCRIMRQCWTMSQRMLGPCCSRPRCWWRCARERCGPAGSGIALLPLLRMRWMRLLCSPMCGRYGLARLAALLLLRSCHAVVTAAAGPPPCQLPCPLPLPLSHARPHLSNPLLPPPPCLQEAQACLEELSQAASLSGDLAAQLEGQMLAAALATGQVKEGAKLPLLPPVMPPPPPVATVCTGTQTPAQAQVQAKQGLAVGFLGAAAKPAAAAACKAGAAAEAAAGPATPAQAAGEAAPAAADQHPVAPQQAGAAAAAAAGTRQGRPSRPSRPSRPGSAGGSQPEVAIDPLHQLVARTDANQGR